jgi:nuclear GTP-binding protein
LQVLDARDPMGTRSPKVESHLRESAKHKHLIFVLNKCDLVPTWVTKKCVVCGLVVLVARLWGGAWVCCCCCRCVGGAVPGPTPRWCSKGAAASPPPPHSPPSVCALNSHCRWVTILSAEYPTLAFHSSITNPFGKGALIQLLRQFSNLHTDKKQVSVGFIGALDGGGAGGQAGLCRLCLVVVAVAE